MLLYYDMAHLAFPDVRRFGSSALTDIKNLLGGSVEEAVGEILLLGCGGRTNPNPSPKNRGKGRKGGGAAAAAVGDGTSISLQQLKEWTRYGQECSEVCEEWRGCPVLSGPHLRVFPPHQVHLLGRIP